MKKSFLFNLFLVLLVCAGLYLLFFTSLDFITNHGNEVKVPDVKGKNIKEAVAVLEKAGFEINVDSSYDPSKPPLLVMDQQPAFGAVVKEGRTIFMTVNKTQPPSTPMPNLLNVSYRSALMMLKNSKLILGDTTYKPDIAKGAVLEQLIGNRAIRPGEMVPQGSRINLVIGDGLGNTELEVPDVIGMTFVEAVSYVNVSGLSYNIIWDKIIIDSNKAIVYNQQPAAINEIGMPNHLREGDEIVLFIKQYPTEEEMARNRNVSNQVIGDTIK